MFGYMIDLSGLRTHAKILFDMQWRRLAGFAFMALAMAAIEYDEFIAPEVNRISDAFSNVATDFSRKLASFTL
jgi:hypothetical protein